MNGFSFTFYLCPQLITDVNCKFFGVCDPGIAEIKKESSLDYSNCNETEGNIAVCFP